MWNYFKQMRPVDKAMFIIGAAVGVLFIFALSWALAIGCVALGYGPEVCGL